MCRCGSTKVETYKGERALRGGVKHMASRGYTVNSMTAGGQHYKLGKAAVLTVVGGVLIGPVGLLAGMFAGRKKAVWTVVYTCEQNS